jgi:hypothetical protein
MQMIEIKKQKLRDAADRCAAIVIDGGYVEHWKEGAIFPSEMAFFMAVCEVADIQCVVESGRQDGYSTEILGDWADRNGATVFSIDLEHDVERAKACRARLARFKSLRLVSGNAYAEFGRVTKQLSQRTAFLVDGPKRSPAISMMSAAMSENVHVIASHNLIAGSEEYDFFFKFGGSEIFFEQAISDPGPRWLELRERDIAHASKSQAARSVELSSIGVLVLNDEMRRAIRETHGVKYGLHQPAFVRALWSIGAYRFAPLLYGLSYRLFGR